MSGELGQGTANTYETLTLTDGMTVKELLAQLAGLPPTAKIGVRLRGEIVAQNWMRIPVEVAGGSIAGREL